jgi:ribosome recycling factor
MHPLLLTRKAEFQATIEHFQGELGSLRTGRATPALVENISVPAYDGYMPLSNVASIGVQDSKTLVISPWDKSLLQAIEKAIRDSDVGANPAVDGSIVRLVMPQMTEETRKKMVKIMREKAEEARIALRGVRESIRDEAGKKEKDKEFGEDEKFKILDELDKVTKEFNDLVEEIAEKKEEEIMTV